MENLKAQITFVLDEGTYNILEEKWSSVISILFSILPINRPLSRFFVAWLNRQLKKTQMV